MGEKDSSEMLWTNGEIWEQRRKKQTIKKQETKKDGKKKGKQDSREIQRR